MPEIPGTDRETCAQHAPTQERYDPLRSPEMIARFGDPDDTHPAGFAVDDRLVFRTKREAIEYELQRERESRRPDRYVYFIQAGPRGPIKIGVAGDPWARVYELSVGSAKPLTLLAVMPGGETVEASLHEEFSALWLRGEWFRPAAALRKRIREVRSTHTRLQRRPVTSDRRQETP